MTTDFSPPASKPSRPFELASVNPTPNVADVFSTAVLRALSSLKLTVALFVMGILIILVGTLAQVDKDMWQVIDEYFRSWIARIEFQVFFPRTWFPRLQNIPYAIWFPGGATIGALMVMNLLAAHLVRFRAHASPARLVAGTAVIVAGSALTAYVIAAGHNRAGVQGHPSLSWETLWLLVKCGLAVASGFTLYRAWLLRRKSPKRVVETWLYGVSGTVLGVLTVWTFLARDGAYLGDSGMRILWQLIQATLCGLVLLAGCLLVFQRRGGIVLIHAGIGLMMFGQFFVSKYDVEEQMRIDEGQTRDYAEDIRQTEMAVIDASDPAQDRVIVVPRTTLLASAGESGQSLFSGRPPEVDAQGVIRHPDLPFDLRVLRYYRNADLVDIQPNTTNPATQGFGLRFVAAPAKPAAGADTGGSVDIAAAYVRLIKKDGNGDLGTVLLSQLASLQNLTERVELEGKTYELALRFQRNYKPYSVTLLDVRKDDYVGTSTPRNYSSDIRLVDSSRGVDREIHIWMNNPLRYAGETFYQSGYSGPPDTASEATTLSVVTNSGWMIPYVSCMIVIVGLAYHFVGMLTRFLLRPDAGQVLARWGMYNPGGIGVVALVMALVHGWGRRRRPAPGGSGGKTNDPRGSRAETVSDVYRPALEPITWHAALAAIFPLTVVGFFVTVLIGSLWPRSPRADGMDVRAFGKLPVIADGRVKPFDTLARNTLRVISNRETFRDADGRSQPAVRWLLDVITRPDVAESHRVFRIDNLEVLDTLGLKRRAGNLYSVAEMRPKVEEFEKQVAQAQEDSRTKGAENLTTYQRKLLELDRRIRAYTRLAAAFQPPRFPPLESGDKDQLERFREAFVSFLRGIQSIQPPLAVPSPKEGRDAHQQNGEWQSYAEAMAFAQIMPDASPALTALNSILVAYSREDATKFSEEIQGYTELLRRERPEQLMVSNSFWNRNVERVFGTFYGFEEFFNQAAPFFFCWFPYLAAAALAAASWLVWRNPLLRSAWWLTVFAFAVHTLALGARIYISGRPPVTNLYSSAVFIGWGVVVFCLVWELFTRNGLPTFLGSLLGFASLVVAHQLAGDGDTFVVLQAVLDTQFWLATHVVLITMGYATTFLAGGIGAAYVLRGLLTPTLHTQASKEMARMIYGTTCFALFFSFFGTVLGGLWADDSWGRFWGWDPKENGALIIVLWNALILHARWDGMAKDRGLAVLAVGGNIVTSWSWFGVNELGVGLHSYGFTEGVLLSLGLFWISQMLIIIPGCLPKAWWWSFAARPASTS